MSKQLLPGDGNARDKAFERMSQPNLKPSVADAEEKEKTVIGRRLGKSPYEQMKQSLERSLKGLAGAPEDAESTLRLTRLMDDIPKKWEKHGDLILLPANAFQDPSWEQLLGEGLWTIVSECLKCRRLGRKRSVSSDHFRSSRVQLIVGEDAWVEHRDNGIRYTYDVTKCMFSAGNITEKLRIAAFDCSREVVVDLYAGIGYFTLPYLVHASAVHVHACEWNPNAVEALRRNLVLNKVQDRCTIHFGDNRIVCPVDVADRVNLGLIPSCEQGLESACRALKRATGGILHIHGNVTSDSKGPSSLETQWEKDEEIEFRSRWSKKARTRPEWERWGENVRQKLLRILRETSGILWNVSLIRVEFVKSYAPRISHVVLDARCTPPSCQN